MFSRMDQNTITSRYARKSCSATETKYVYKIVILFTVDSFVSTFRKVTRAVIDLVDSFYSYGTEKLNLVGFWRPVCVCISF